MAQEREYTALQAENKQLRIERDTNADCMLEAVAKVTELEAERDEYQNRLIEECPCLSLDGDGTCPLPSCLGRDFIPKSTESSE